jgi:hypothetical protein
MAVRRYLLGLLWLPMLVLGHPDLDPQILAVTCSIEQDPTNAVLYLRPEPPPDGIH